MFVQRLALRLLVALGYGLLVLFLLVLMSI